VSSVPEKRIGQVSFKGFCKEQELQNRPELVILELNQNDTSFKNDQVDDDETTN